MIIEAVGLSNPLYIPPPLVRVRGIVECVRQSGESGFPLTPTSLPPAVWRSRRLAESASGGVRAHFRGGFALAFPLLCSRAPEKDPHAYSVCH